MRTASPTTAGTVDEGDIELVFGPPAESSDGDALSRCSVVLLLTHDSRTTVSRPVSNQHRLKLARLFPV